MLAGKGLIGGIPFTGDGYMYQYQSWHYMTNMLILYSYTNSGYKGESHVSRAYLSSGNIPPVYPDFAKGKGANFKVEEEVTEDFQVEAVVQDIWMQEEREAVEIMHICGPGSGDGNGLGGQAGYITLYWIGGILLGGGGGSSTSDSW